MKKLSLLAVISLLLIITNLTIAAGGILPGSGTSTNPYLIEDLDDFDFFTDPNAHHGAMWSEGNHIKLNTDIDLSGRVYKKALIGYDEAGSNYVFCGTFDGAGHCIKNLYINNPMYLCGGLFGLSSNTSIIKNLRCEDFNIIAGSYIGGLCGRNYGYINNCFINGSIKGRARIGGLCGINGGTLKNCYSTAYVDGGVLCSQVEEGGKIINCYYYKFGGANNNLGTPLEDSQLTDKNSYIGFDFDGDSSDGTLDIWKMEPGYTPSFADQAKHGFTAPNRIDSISTTLLGTGYPDDPFRISSNNDIIEFRNNPQLRIGNYILETDIDLSGTVYSEAFIPEYFHGNFDGNNYTISNLSINGENYFLGFFSINSGLINNLNLENTSVIGHNTIGGLCGNNIGVIKNCSIEGSCSGNNYVGLLSGSSNYGSIINTSSSGIVSGMEYVGGLCGSINYSKLSRCYSYSTVSGNSYVGGLTGYSSRSTFSYCDVTATVSGGYCIGGICGRTHLDEINKCITECNVSGNTNVGGFCGSNNSSEISNSYNKSTVSGDSEVGGICGHNSYSDIMYCYNTGFVKGKTSRTTGAICGVHHGNNRSLLMYCSWDTETSNVNNGYNIDSRYPGYVDEVAGFNTEDMKIKTPYIEWGWNIINKEGDSADWFIIDGFYPRLSWEELDIIYLPNIVGMEKNEAIDILPELNIEVKYDFSDQYPDGYVISQELEEGSPVFVGGNIEIIVSCGEGVLVPDISEMSQENAENTIIQAGLIPGQILTEYSMIPVGDAINTSPEIGTRILPGTTIDIVVSIGPSENIIGQGTEENPYLIMSLNAFLEFANSDNKDKYLRYQIHTRLETDIDLSSYGVVSHAFIGNSFIFDGNFDGNGHIIKNLSIEGESNCGLFENIGYGGKVSNLGLVDVSIIGENHIGSIAGISNGNIINCYSTGELTGYAYVGGLVGMLRGYSSDSPANVSNCYSTINILGERRYIGGLAGYTDSYGCITNCYNAGLVNGTNEYTGAISGYLAESEINVNSSYYYINCIDFDNSVSSFSSLDRLDLINQTSFQGFDFIGNSFDGTEDIWDITPGYMPKLAWQTDNGFAPPYYLESIETILTGTGYADDPFLISTINDFEEFTTNTELRKGYFLLDNDLDLSEMSYTEALIREDFYGTFDGGNHTIIGLTINGAGNLGLFNNNYGRIRNLGLEKVNINSTADYTGSLACVNYGKITSCYCTGAIQGKCNYVGGLVAYNEKTGYIDSCYTAINIKASDSYEKYLYYFGGLIGYNDGDVSQCYSIGNIETEYTYQVGGLVGYSSGNINNCYSQCDVFSKTVNAGSLIGSYYYLYSSSLINCYSSGIVTIDSFEPHNNGLIGYSNNTIGIENCFWDKEKNNFYNSDKGGIGLSTAQMQMQNTFADANWNFNDENGNSQIWQLPENSYPILNWGIMSPNLAGKTANEAETILRESGLRLGKVAYGFNTAILEGHIISQSHNSNHVHKNAFIDITISAAGSGTETDPYLIQNFDQFKEFCSNEIYWAPGVHFRLEADINLDPSLPGREIYTQAPISPIESVTYYGGRYYPLPYYGHFDGNGHVIKNLTIYGESFCALFGYTAPGSSISNLGLENINITATEQQAGGLVANSHSIVNNCYTTGQVTCNNGRAGGFYASTENTYPITYVPMDNYGQTKNCYSTCNVTGCIDVGGFAGFSRQTLIENCYATGNVTGINYTGGFVGQMHIVDNYFAYTTTPLIKNCYSIGKVEYTESGGGFAGIIYGTCIVSNCFWDIDTSGQTVSEQGTGKTTAEMQDIQTYLDADWDFDYSDDASAAWFMPANSYPILSGKTADIIKDYNVDLADFTAFSQSWLSQDRPEIDYDFSGTIDLVDLQIFTSCWLTNTRLPLDDHLELLLELDEADGDVILDSSDFNRNGTFYGGPERIPGKFGSCYSFDGVFDYILLDTYHGLSGATPRTVSAWINAKEDLSNSEQSLHTILSWGFKETGKMWQLLIDNQTGQLAAAIYGARLKGGPDLEDGLWHHVAAVLPDGANNINQVKLYVDGIEIATNASELDLEINTTATGHVLIGALNISAVQDTVFPERFFDGAIDDVRIYNTGLSIQEVSELASE